MGPEDPVAAAQNAAEASPALVLARPTERTPVTGITIIEGSSSQAASLQASLPDADVVPDFPITLIEPAQTRVLADKPTDDDLWHLGAVRLRDARNAGFTGTGKGVTIAITDTGVQEVDEIQGKVRAAYLVDRMGTPPGVRRLEETYDTDGHGTHVAGLICGTTVGVAPEAQVENVIMIPGGRGNFSDFIFAMEHIAAQAHISIMNMSAGIPGYDGRMQPALASLMLAGVLPIIATGNEGRNTSRSPGNYRAALSIGAARRNGSNGYGVASFSSGGQMSVDGMLYTVPDCIAPGEDVTSCVMGGGYEAWDGTSMATPVVAGIAALIIEQHPTITVADLEQMILGSCRDLGLPDTREGAGLIELPSSMWGAATIAAVRNGRRRRAA